MTRLARNPGICEKILQLNTLSHANRLETIPRPPMPQHNPSTHQLLIKSFDSCLPLNVATHSGQWPF